MTYLLANNSIMGIEQLYRSNNIVLSHKTIHYVIIDPKGQELMALHGEAVPHLQP